MRALHRIGAGEPSAKPVQTALFSLTRRAAPTIRRCCGLQTKQCSWLSDHAILRPGRGTDVDRCDATSLAILLPTPYTWCDRGFSLCSRPQSTSTGGSRTHFLQTDATLSHSMRRPSSTISRRGYPFSAILTSPPERRVDAICRSCLLSRPPSRSRSAPSPGQASPVNECREKPQTCEADVNSGLPGMSWAINVWHDDETGLEQLTARLQQQLRPAPNALCGTLPGKASGYVWIAMSGDKQSCSSLSRNSRLAVIAASPPAGVTATVEALDRLNGRIT
ncbi:hypothetical protein SAMN05192541_12223 [Bradyrhizobium arachidis]|nr:hypothetical protein SAMN05192541_12223 [Bradyrhizobium arachidis]